MDEVKAVDLSDLNVVKARCEVMFELGDDAFENVLFCSGDHVNSLLSDDDDSSDDTKEDDPVEDVSGFDEVKDAVCSLLCSV